VTADGDGLALGGASDEQLLRVDVAAVRLGDPLTTVGEGLAGRDLTGCPADDRVGGICTLNGTE
jgi:hypothetical protein